MSGYKSIDPENETRLLKFVLRAGEDLPIIGTLVHTSLASPLPYEALSYVWGNSVTGFLSDVEPDTEGIGFVMAPTGSSNNITKSKMEDIVNHPELQYALWTAGFPRPKGKILLDGKEVEVGGELYAALQRLSHLWTGPDGETGEGVYVWIDALCINQENIEERNRHIKNMGKIYSKAEKVRIWLGEAASDADRIAFEALYELNDFFTGIYKNQDLSDHAAVRQRFMAEPAMQSLNWSCLSSLLRRNWFTRTWVIQEITFAQCAYVHLGVYVCTWQLLSAAILMLRNLDLDQPLWAYTEFTADTTVGLMDRLHRAETLRRSNKIINMEADQAELCLLDILHESRDFKCTMKHDKIYGVLNLAADSHKYPIPNYSLTVENIFKDFATTRLSEPDGLNILYHCSKGAKEAELTLPSWVPDWTQKCHHIPFYLTALKCNAAGSSTPYYQLSKNDSILTVRGQVRHTIQQVDQIRNIPRNSLETPKHVDTIKSLLNGEDQKLWMGPDLDRNSQQEWMSNHQTNLFDWVSNVMEIAFPNKTIEPNVFEALWRTFVCDQTREGEVPPPTWGSQFANFVQGTKKRFGEDKGLWFEEILSPGSYSRFGRRKWDLTEKFDSLVPPELGEYMEFVRTNGTWCYNRRFFKTEDGRFGWGPNGISVGDMVTVIDGLNVPLVLRPVQGGYGVVGDCYTHGIMFGEGMTVGIENMKLAIL